MHTYKSANSKPEMPHTETNEEVSQDKGAKKVVREAGVSYGHGVTGW